MSDKRLGELIESIATHYSAIAEVWVEFVKLAGPHDGEGNYRLTHLDAKEWEITPASLLAVDGGNIGTVHKVWRALHTDYVFVQSAVKLDGNSRPLDPFIAILRASHEKKAT